MVNSISTYKLDSKYSDIFNFRENKNDDITNQEVSNILQKAKAIYYQKVIKTNNPQIANLILMAEVSLKNGNSAAAYNFANKAIQILSPEPDKGLNIKKNEYYNLYNKNKKDNNIKLFKDNKQTVHKYKDVSNDAGVSFTYPSNLTGPESFLAVPAHEAEHVGKRVGEAVFNGERILVTVSYDIRYDPSTGQPYMAGGETRTIVLSHGKNYNNNKILSGRIIDFYI